MASQTIETDIAIIGAGPAGLAVSAALKQQGISSTIFEKGSGPGLSWAHHYDRLHLHTVRWLSGLPGYRIPGRYGPWVSRDHFIEYLGDYARKFDLTLRTGFEVQSIKHQNQRWLLNGKKEDVLAKTVVVATGTNHTPRIPEWEGCARFRGKLIHSRNYKNGSEYRSKDVLVIGTGNSGAEIATDLVEQGAKQVWLSYRTPPNIVTRRALGLPSQVISIGLSRLPLTAADFIAGVAARLNVGDLSAYGVPKAPRGIYTQIVRDRQVPIIDVGFTRALRTGKLKLVPTVRAFDHQTVHLIDGSQMDPNAVIAATGFENSLKSFLGDLDVLDKNGLPRAHGASTLEEFPGLFFIGFTTPPAGNLREIARDARRISQVIARQRNE